MFKQQNMVSSKLNNDLYKKCLSEDNFRHDKEIKEMQADEDHTTLLENNSTFRRRNFENDAFFSIPSKEVFFQEPE